MNYSVLMHMTRPASPITGQNITGGFGLTKLEYAAVHIAGCIRASTTGETKDYLGMNSADLARQALEDAKALLALVAAEQEKAL